MISPFIPFIVIIFAALCGVILTIYIFNKKRRHEAMVCPLNGHCDTVVNSEFSKFLGVPVELIGMFYYSMVALAYAVFLLVPILAAPLLTLAVFVTTMLAFLFSAYLIFIQLFYIKQYCTWCLGSAGLSTVIFGLSLFISGGSAVLLVAPYLNVVLGVYSLALALGLGSATFSVIFLGKFLKDLYVSHLEAQLMQLVSQVTWLALGLLFVMGAIGYVTPSAHGSAFPISPLHLVILLAMICGGALLDLLVAPRLIAISSGQDHMHKMGELRLLRRAALALAAIILVSWYVLFAMSTLSLSGSTLLVLMYVGLLVIGLVVSGFMEQRLAKKVF
ncbi:MAG: vitamin K epoxide reductase family protein [Candidatus Andersenbacteria bacterium]|nr:vitamin K epoxide reductase family protein [Candidatus Andersenbacteria bacterium]